MEEKARVPAIRFKGFTQAWEKRELSEILERRQITQKISNEAPRLAFASGQGVIPLSERRTNNRDQLISDETAKRYLLTEFNDIVYNPANLKYGAIDRNKYGKGVISPIYVTFTTQEIPSFVERIVTTEKFKLKALQFEEGTVVKRQSVSPGNLLSFEEMISPSKEEQQKIGDYFDILESLITLHQLKHLKLKNVKKVMLEKMFPQNGCNVPEIRFAGFNDEWKQFKLGEITSYESSSYSVNQFKDKETNGVYPLFDANNLVTLLDVYDQEDKYISIIKDGAGVGRVKLRPAKSSVIGTMGYIINKDTDLDFIFYIMQRLNIFVYVTGSTIPHIYYKDYSNENLFIPSLVEQKQISGFLKKLDNLITLHQRKLEKLKNIKKACLENMFV